MKDSGRGFFFTLGVDVGPGVIYQLRMSKTLRPAAVLPASAIVIEDNQRTPLEGSTIFIRCSKSQVYAYVKGLAGSPGFWEGTEPAPDWADKAQGSFTRFDNNGSAWVPDYSARFWVPQA